MKAARDALIIQIEAEFPGWQVWVVPVFIGPDVWCARRHDDHGRVLNYYGPDDLRDAIREANNPPAEPFGIVVADRIPPDGPGTHRIPPDVRARIRPTIASDFHSDPS